jgi:hypothetical protein
MITVDNCSSYRHVGGSRADQNAIDEVTGTSSSFCFSFHDHDGNYLIPDLLDKQEPETVREFQPAALLDVEELVRIEENSAQTVEAVPSDEVGG